MNLKTAKTLGPASGSASEDGAFALTCQVAGTAAAADAEEDELKKLRAERIREAKAELEAEAKAAAEAKLNPEGGGAPQIGERSEKELIASFVERG